MSDPAGVGNELASLNFKNMIGAPLVACVEAQVASAKSTVEFIKNVGFDSTGKVLYADFTYPKEVAPYKPPKRVKQINLVIAGTGYTTNPNVVIDPPPPGGTQATATVTMVSGAITAINVSNPGSGYTATPNITIEAPSSGTQATATVTLEDVSTPAVFQQMVLSVPYISLFVVPCLLIDKVHIEFNAKINSMEYDSSSSSTAVGASASFSQRWVGGRVNISGSFAHKSATSSGSKIERSYALTIVVDASQAPDMPPGLEKVLNILEKCIVSQPSSQQTSEPGTTIQGA